MIKNITLRNFEAHKNTVLSNLSPYVNLILGASNTGKTSIIRALKLLAYNEFDKNSVRVNSSSVEVIVETDKGVVQVNRGVKVNKWIVKDNNGAISVFDKVGKGEVQRVGDILGIKMIKLGDVDVSVNIMNQLEAHFMLSAIGDNDVSGSVRAQVLDEISGLVGVEGIINDVGLDIYRATRRINDLKIEIDNQRQQLINEQEIEEERKILDETSQCVSEYDVLREKVQRAEVLKNKRDLVSKRILEVSNTIEKLQDILQIQDMLDTVECIVVDWKRCDDVVRSGQDLLGRIYNIKHAIINLKNIDLVNDDLSSLEGVVIIWRRLQDMFDEFMRCSIRKDSVLKELDKMAGVVSVGIDLDELKKLVDEINKRVEVYNKCKELLIRQDKVKLIVASVNDVIDKCKKDIDDLLKNVRFCPLTQMPISGECAKMIQQITGG